jgi:menaquinone-specific isochorismate synthase
VSAMVPSEDEWRDAVASAVVALRAGDLQKVVLARAIDVTARSGLDARAVAARLALRFPACFTYLCDGLVGASPELLIRRLGRHAESLVLAGTVRRGATPEEDAALERGLLDSAKDAAEHRMAADSVREVLAEVAADVVSDQRPQLLRLANLSHLATHVEAWLPEPAPSALALAALLHPSAAVGGTPRPEALAMIHQLEAAPRGRYAALRAAHRQRRQAVGRRRHRRRLRPGLRGSGDRSEVRRRTLRPGLTSPHGHEPMRTDLPLQRLY